MLCPEEERVAVGGCGQGRETTGAEWPCNARKVWVVSLGPPGEPGGVPPGEPGGEPVSIKVPALLPPKGDPRLMRPSAIEAATVTAEPELSCTNAAGTESTELAFSRSTWWAL